VQSPHESRCGHAAGHLKAAVAALPLYFEPNRANRSEARFIVRAPDDVFPHGPGETSWCFPAKARGANDFATGGIEQTVVRMKLGRLTDGAILPGAGENERCL